MKKFLSCLSLCCLVLLSGCSSPEAFQEVEIDAKELQEKLDDKEDFVVIVEREGCSYCEALEHAGLVLYKLDSTDFDLKREKEEDMTLVTTNEDGQILLKMAPYFLYTPSLYIVEDGKAIQAGIGYNDLTHEVSLWDVDSTIDFNQAEPQDFWSFVENGQAK